MTIIIIIIINANMDKPASCALAFREVNNRPLPWYSLRTTYLANKLTSIMPYLSLHPT